MSMFSQRPGRTSAKAVAATLLFLVLGPVQAGSPDGTARDSALVSRYGLPDAQSLRYLSYDAAVPAVRLQNTGAKMALVVEVGLGRPEEGRCRAPVSVKYFFETKLKTGEVAYFRVPDGQKLADAAGRLCVRAVARRTRAATWSDVSFATVYAPLGGPGLARLNAELGTRYEAGDAPAAPTR